MVRRLLLVAALVSLNGCTSMRPPAPEGLAALPIVEFPATPPQGDFILKLPKGKPIPTRVLIDGTALANGADQILDATLANDLYVHREWVSEDGKTWRHYKNVLDIRVAVMLPGYEHPKPGEIRLTVDNAKQ